MQIGLSLGEFAIYVFLGARGSSAVGLGAKARLKRRDRARKKHTLQVPFIINALVPLVKHLPHTDKAYIIIIILLPGYSIAGTIHGEAP